MHGLIFTSFLQFTRHRFPEQVDAIWREEPRFLATAAYPDDDFVRILERTASVTSTPSADLLRQFGSFAAQTTFRLLYPDYYAESGSTRTFLLEVEGRIHDLVRATISDASPPKLHVVPLGAEGVMVTYTSERGLCDLVHGLIIGTALHFEERFDVEQVQCMREGDPACAFVVERAG